MTGSRIAAALGLSPWTSPFTLFHQMRGNLPESTESAPMEWGTRLEGAVVQKYADNHPNIKLNRKAGVWQSIEHPFLVASPDGLITAPGAPSPRRPNGILEAKTSQYDDEWDNGPPVWYICQVRLYLLIFGFESADVAVLFHGNDYREYTVGRDETDEALMIKAAEEFLAKVAADEAPPLDGSDSTYRTILAMHPEITKIGEGSTVDVPPALVAALADSKAILARFTEEHTQLTSELAQLMGNAHKAFCNTHKVADRRAKGLTGTPYVQLSPITTLRKAL